jgi:hypothetical protein
LPDGKIADVIVYGNARSIYSAREDSTAIAASTRGVEAAGVCGEGVQFMELAGM